MKYADLSEKAKRKAVEWMQESNGEHFDGDFVIDEWKNLLGCLGFTDIDIFWSGFCSQGDGACFIGSWSVDWLGLEKVPGYTSDERAKELVAYPEKVRGLYKLLSTIDEDEEDFESPVVVGATLKHRGHYYHENSIDYTFDTGYAYPTDDAETEFKDWCKDMMRMIYKDLEAEYEWVTGEEYAVDAIECNDYNFNEEGEVE